ncbi:MAG TPA: RDD family protein [Acetivibrio sp.]|nr:RDD family protein [Clostridium sp.]HOQ38093.1 RDD family protein [Acetivibrio sp.]HPT91166.1 RDD family protein [Acetivibrio sp.]HQA58665.1 RDD family protein [Acetivibrio sp.]
MSLFDGEYDSNNRLTIIEIKPWTRFWARTVDIYIVSTIINAMQLIFFQGTLFDSMLLSLGSSFIWALAEAHLIYTWGTTPGKWLFNTEVKTYNLKKPDLFASIKRSILVWALGTGMGIFSSITYLISYFILTRRGYTIWDRYAECVVIHKKMSENRVLAAVFVIVGLIIVNLAFGFINAIFYLKDAGMIQ